MDSDFKGKYTSSLEQAARRKEKQWVTSLDQFSLFWEGSGDLQSLAGKQNSRYPHPHSPQLSPRPGAQEEAGKGAQEDFLGRGLEGMREEETHPPPEYC